MASDPSAVSLSPFYSTGLNPAFTVPITNSTDFTLDDDDDDDDDDGGDGGDHNDRPTPVPSGARSEQGDAGEVYLPGLTSATLFGIVPETDTLSLVVDKYVPRPERPRRDLSGSRDDDAAESIDELAARGSWRAVAACSRDAILAADASQTSHILSHWALRLHALLRLHLTPLATAELNSLFALLPTAPVHPAVPFELHVLRASVDPNPVEALAQVLQAAKSAMWASGDAREKAVWRARAERVGLVLSGVLVSLKAFPSAAHILSPPAPTRPVLTALARLHLSTGSLVSFAHSAALLGDPHTDAVGLIANGDWPAAERAWRALVAADPTDLQAQNNLAVSLLFIERLDDAIDLLRSLALRTAEEPVLFNLATLIELRTDHAVAEKVRLLKAVVAASGGEGVRAGCFKLVL